MNSISSQGTMSDYANLLTMARQVIHRLERLSVDSHWAHRASGLRRSLVRCTDELEEGGVDAPQTACRLEELLQQGFSILENAAREMGDHT
jgi:hypothetical protein